MDLRERLMPCISSSHAETCAAKVHRPAFNPAQVLDALADHEPLTSKPAGTGVRRITAHVNGGPFTAGGLPGRNGIAVLEACFVPAATLFWKGGPMSN